MNSINNLSNFDFILDPNDAILQGMNQAAQGQDDDDDTNVQNNQSNQSTNNQNQAVSNNANANQSANDSCQNVAAVSTNIPNQVSASNIDTSQADIAKKLRRRGRPGLIV